MFAKIFGPDNDQIVIMLREVEGKPAVQIYGQPPGAGVCISGVGFDDTDEGWGKAQKCFDTITEADARTIFRPIAEMFPSPSEGAQP